MMQNEITKPGPLLNANGHVANPGYSKRMLLEYDRAAIKAKQLRIKEWDYYIALCGDYAVALTVADNSYMGLMSASILDFRAPWYKTTSVMTLLPRGKTNMPPSSAQGDVVFENKRCRFSFSFEGKDRRLRCHMDDFSDKQPFDCDILLTDEPAESMVIATPFAEKKTAFYYNQKINCMRAAGSAEWAGNTYAFDPKQSFGTLDWGRGVWTYSNTWYWGSASGLAPDGKTFGFNIGYGFGDTSAASENMLFYDGRAHKLEQVDFGIPRENGKDDFMSPWRFSSSDGRFEMEFVPVVDRFDNTDALVLKSWQHQVFGRFSGTATLDDGTQLEIKNLMGFAEKVSNRW